MTPALKTDVPEIEAASRVARLQYHVHTVGDKSIKPKGCMVDTTDNLKVTGILKNLPNNAQFDFETAQAFKKMKR